MHICLIADPCIPIPPKKYGGIERIVDMLINGYLSKGHEVTLFAHSQSKVRCNLVKYGIRPHKGFLIRSFEILQIWQKLFLRKNNFDIIHSFGRLAGLSCLFFSTIPKVQSYQRPISSRNVLIASMLARKSIIFTACSNSCRRYGEIPGNWTTIYNGVQIHKYDFNPRVEEDAPLVFLGRIEPVKGVHTAIEVAIKSKRKLIIAGNIVSAGPSFRYFKEKIEPLIDAKQIIYVGEVDDVLKNELLRDASALLMPIEWDEPFGIVAVEALACGTPVIGFNRGAMPEIIQDGINGFLCENMDDFLIGIGKIEFIDRLNCRKIAESKFSDTVLVNQYLSLYKGLIKGYA